jgi:hypothetical protein
MRKREVQSIPYQLLLNYLGVHNKIDIIDLRVWQFETLGLDSGWSSPR